MQSSIKTAVAIGAALLLGAGGMFLARPPAGESAGQAPARATKDAGDAPQPERTPFRERARLGAVQSELDRMQSRQDELEAALQTLTDQLAERDRAIAALQKSQAGAALSGGAAGGKAAKAPGPLLVSVAGGDVEAVRALLAADDLDLDAKDDRGRNALFHCTTAEMAELLIAAGMDVHATDAAGNSPLFLNEHADVVKVLLAAGGDANHRGGVRMTPMFNLQSADVGRVLLEHGADLTLRDDLGRTPLHTPRYPATTQFLIEQGLDTNARDTGGMTPLFRANDEEVIGRLIDAGADVNARDHSSRTPLFNAQSPEGARRLIEAGADVNARDENKVSVLAWQRKRNHRGRASAVIKVLIENGALE